MRSPTGHNAIRQCVKVTRQRTFLMRTRPAFSFALLPTHSMVTKGESCSGGKTSKDRITVLLAASATGEKLKPLVFGRAKKPRCFCDFEVATLGVIYDFNKKAWMTSSIFTAWLNRIKNQMRFQQRHILMFVDNCWAHPDEAAAMLCRHHPDSEDALQEAASSSRSARDGGRRDRHSVRSRQVGHRPRRHHLTEVRLGSTAGQYDQQVLCQVWIHGRH